jgi:adiponectin receptor
MLPEWLVDNPYILSGYRYGKSNLGPIRELFLIHNETFNAWTMIISSVISVGLWIWVNMKHDLTLNAFIVFTAFLISGTISVPYSIQYHTRSNISKDEKSRTRRLDMVFVFIASIFLTFALSFFVFPLSVTSVLTLCSAYFARHIYLTYHGASNNKQEITTVMFQAVAVYLTPLAYASLVDFKMASYFITVFSSLALGALIYIFNLPERWFPGRFDILGSSHQIMHVFLIIAHIVEFLFIYKMGKF